MPATPVRPSSPRIWVLASAAFADPATLHGFTQVPNFILTSTEISVGAKLGTDDFDVAFDVRDVPRDVLHASYYSARAAVKFGCAHSPTLSLARDIADGRTEIVENQHQCGECQIRRRQIGHMRDRIADIRSELKNMRHQLGALESVVQRNRPVTRSRERDRVAPWFGSNCCGLPN